MARFPPPPNTCNLRGGSSCSRIVHAAFFAIAALLLSLKAASAEPDVFPSEGRGMAVHLMPSAHDDMGGHDRWFEAFIPQQTDIKPAITARSAPDFVAKYQQLPREVQQYGIWLTLTRNDLDSLPDQALLERLEALCKQHGLPLFIRTGFTGDWLQISGPSLEGDVLRPKDLPSWSVCTSWSPIQRALVGRWAMPLTVTIEYEDGVPKSPIVSNEVVEITFTADRRYMEGVRGEPTQLTGRWCLDNDDLILQFDTQPKRGERIPWQRRGERVSKVSEKELVFSKTYPVWADATEEGVWTRVR